MTLLLSSPAVHLRFKVSPAIGFMQGHAYLTTGETGSLLGMLPHRLLGLPESLGRDSRHLFHTLPLNLAGWEVPVPLSGGHLLDYPPYPIDTDCRERSEGGQRARNQNNRVIQQRE